MRGKDCLSGSCPLQGELDLQNVEDYRCLNAVFLLITGGLTELYESQVSRKSKYFSIPLPLICILVICTTYHGYMTLY